MSSNNLIGDIAFDLPKNKSNVIKVIGVGGGGSNAINYMFQQGIKGVDFVICNTDAQALQNSGVPNKIQLGVHLTEGLGAGANPEVGEQSAVESLEDIRRMLDTNTKMVFITAGMGGGTGTGAAPIIAKMAREMDILTVGIVTMPFQFEGKTRVDQAQVGVENLRQHVDSLIIINNNKLREVYGNLGFKAGFAKADEVLATASRGIAEVITHHYTQNIDLRDAKTVLSNSGTAIMGSATASGQNRAQEAVMIALDSPLLNDNKITGAKNVLLLIVSGTNEITIDEIGEINDYIQTEAGHGANIIMGVGEDLKLEESISVTIIATGFHIDQQHEISNTEVKKVIHKLEDSQATTYDFNLKEDILPFQRKPTNTDTKNNTISHLLTDEDALEEEFNIENIPSNEFINNINVDFDEIQASKIETSSNNKEAEEIYVNNTPNESKTSPKAKQTTLNFEFPVFVPKEQDPEPPKKLIYDLNTDDIKDIEVNEPKEIVWSPNSQAEKRYTLENPSTPEDTKQEKELEIDQEMVFEKKIVPITPSEKDEKNIGDSSESPVNSTISELLKERNEERRLKMKEFNHKFNASKIDDIEKEPAYKRHGVDLEESQHSSETNMSRLSPSTDENDDIQLRSNNSFLHDNVD